MGPHVWGVLQLFKQYALKQKCLYLFFDLLAGNFDGLWEQKLDVIRGLNKTRFGFFFLKKKEMRYKVIHLSPNRVSKKPSYLPEIWHHKQFLICVLAFSLSRGNIQIFPLKFWKPILTDVKLEEYFCQDSLAGCVPTENRKMEEITKSSRRVGLQSNRNAKLWEKWERRKWGRNNC